ncbi:unnamed protein product [Clavelina lepadiformis]|uniref:Alkaline ceramidase n=1 Tax=Clavelina lepadiformis TaxID=159417 RepID=A0ABP0H4L8_CLALP
MVSNIPFLVLPLIMMSLHKNYSTRVPHCNHVNLVWLLLIGIGIGSIYFHATLSLFGQFIDEIGILWVCCAVMCVWMLDCYLHPWCRRHRSWYQIIVICFALLATLLSFLKPEINHFFLFLFIVPAFMVLKNEMNKSDYCLFKRLCKYTLATWTLALLFWVCDRVFCPFWLHLHFPYLHGIWHILTSIGGCEACVCYAYCYAKEQVSEKQPVLQFYSLIGKNSLCGLWYVTFYDSSV